jgi:hypothetical protein
MKALETVLEAAVEEAEAMGRGWALLDHLPVTKIAKWRLIYQVRRIYEDPHTARDEVWPRCRPVTRSTNRSRSSACSSPTTS